MTSQEEFSESPLSRILQPIKATHVHQLPEFSSDFRSAVGPPALIRWHSIKNFRFSPESLLNRMRHILLLLFTDLKIYPTKVRQIFWLTKVSPSYFAFVGRLFFFISTVKNSCGSAAAAACCVACSRAPVPAVRCCFSFAAAGSGVGYRSILSSSTPNELHTDYC